MKPKNEKHQLTCRIMIAMYEQSYHSEPESYPDEPQSFTMNNDEFCMPNGESFCTVETLSMYVPLWKDFFGGIIFVYGQSWEELFNRCFDYLSSQDSWIQYTANEILNVLRRYGRAFKKDYEKKYPQESRNRETWDEYAQNHYIRLSIDLQSLEDNK